MMFFPVQLFAIAVMFCPGLWVTPPRPPDTPPISRRVVIGYKVFGGLVLSQVARFIPDGSLCQPDSLCDMLRTHDESLARSLLRLDHSPSPPAPLSRPYVSSLLKTTCPVVIIPPRPAPTCRNTDMHPTFEWAPQSLAPSPILAERSCSPSPIPIFLGDERTYVHPNISPFPLPRPTDAAPISRVLLIVVWLSGRKFLGRMCAAVLVLATLVSRRWRHRMQTLRWAEGHDLFQALKDILWLASCGIIGRSYHFGVLTMGAVPIITPQLQLSLFASNKNHALQVVSAGACRVSRISRSLAIVVVYMIWALLVAADFNIVAYKDVSGEILKFVNVRVSWIGASLKLNGLHAMWTSVFATLHTTVHALHRFPACVVVFLRSISLKPSDAAFLPIPSLTAIDMSVNMDITRSMVAAIIPGGPVQITCPVMAEINAATVAPLSIDDAQDPDTDAQTPAADGGEGDITAVPIATASPPPTHAPLPAALLAELIIASPTLVVDEISAEPSAALVVTSMDGTQDVDLQPEVVGGCEDNITFTPPTPPNSLPAIPLLELSYTTDEVTPFEDAFGQEQQPELEAISIPLVIITPVVVQEAEPAPVIIRLPESPAIVPSIDIDNPVYTQLKDIYEPEAVAQPTSELFTVVIVTAAEIISENALPPELEDESKPVPELMSAVDEAFSVDVSANDVPGQELVPELPSMPVSVLVPEREPESDLSPVVKVTPVRVALTDLMDDPTPIDPLPFAAGPKLEGAPQSPPHVPHSTSSANCSTAGESPLEEIKNFRIRRRIRRSIKRANKEAAEKSAESSSTGTRQAITNTTPTRSQFNPQQIRQSPSNRFGGVRRHSESRVRAGQGRQSLSESEPIASSSGVRQNRQSMTRQPLESAPVASYRRVWQNPEPSARQLGRSPSQSVPAASSSRAGRLPCRNRGVGRTPLSRQ